MSDAILDEAALTEWGRAVGRSVDRPVFLGLEGRLGAGKSVLARAIARGAGVAGQLPSPSYGLLHEYPCDRGTLRHLDLYRLGAVDELWEIGWETLGGPGDLVVVEWATRAGDALPDDHWRVTLATVPVHPDLRTVTLRRVGSPPMLPPFPSMPRL